VVDAVAATRNMKRSSVKHVSPLTKGSNSVEGSIDPYHPLLALALESNEWSTDCSGYTVVLYKGNASDPLELLFSLPFPNSGLFEDGLVGLDVVNKLAYMWVSAFRDKKQAGYGGGFLVGMLVDVQKSQGQYFPYGGIYSSPLINDFVPYSLTVVGDVVWAWATIGGLKDGYLTRINPGTGNYTTVLSLPKDHELASPLPTILDSNGILHTLTYDFTGEIFGFVYRVNINTLEVLPVVRINATDPIADCSGWSYDPNTGTTYALCYDTVQKGNFISTIDLNTFQVEFIGSEPLVAEPYLWSTGSFAVNYNEGSAFIIQDGPSLEKTWLVKANLTTGERIFEMGLRGTDAMFVTYLPWVY